MKKIDLKQTYIRPWTYYLYKTRHAINISNAKSMLKTDCYNEARNIPIIGGIAKNVDVDNIYLLEIDGRTVRKAKRQYPELNIIHGDIRDLPLSSIPMVDLLVDLSTLDHIKEDDLLNTLNGYYHSLNTALLLIVWCSKSDKFEVSDIQPNQYFLSYSFLRSALDDIGFRPVEEEECFDYYYYPTAHMVCFLEGK